MPPPPLSLPFQIPHLSTASSSRRSSSISAGEMGGMALGRPSGVARFRVKGKLVRVNMPEGWGGGGAALLAWCPVDPGGG